MRPIGYIIQALPHTIHFLLHLTHDRGDIWLSQQMTE